MPAGEAIGARVVRGPSFPLLRAAGLEAGYARGQAAISGLEFAVAGGESMAVLGPKGGGKTTLFRAVLGELAYTTGELEVTGEVAYVPQGERSRLDFPVSAFDVALMGTYGRLPWYRPIGRAERRSAAEALERVGLTDGVTTPWGELSGGQRQRVLIARAIAQQAGVVLLDEPLAGVDQPSEQRVLQILGELRGEGRAVVVSTHDVELAASFDRVLCINARQIAFGAPAEVLDAEVLREVYGAEIVLLPGGEQAIVQGHGHGSDDHGERR